MQLSSTLDPDNSALITPDLAATVGMSMLEPTVGPTLYTEATFLSSTTEPTQLPTLDPTDSASPLDLTAEEHDAAEPFATSLPTISAPGDQNIDAMFFSAPEQIDDPPLYRCRDAQSCS
ncbi:hypothetical protein ACHAXH_000961 [Discostella pseudostelligera]